MADIKPIETVYNGYRFRSRLEARWAVFFDAAGIKYQYEPEGFTDGKNFYLPDFYFPEDNLYGEVKGSEEQYKKDISKMCAVITDTSRIKKIAVFGEIPMTNNDVFFIPIMYWDTLDDDITIKYKPIVGYSKHGASINTGWVSPRLTPSLCYMKTRKDIDKQNIPLNPYTVELLEHKIRSMERECFGQRIINGENIELIKCQNYVGFGNDGYLRIMLEKARQARFEHGECG